VGKPAHSEVDGYLGRRRSNRVDDDFIGIGYGGR
jgi:hypothetical protein